MSSEDASSNQTLESFIENIRSGTEMTREGATFALSQMGQVAYKDFLTHFVRDHDLSATWESLLYKYLPRLNETTTDDMIEQNWQNYAKVLDIIREQGASDELYQRLDNHVADDTPMGSDLPALDDFLFDLSQVKPCRGLDVGTVNIIGSYSALESDEVHFNVQRNAFLDVSSDEFTRDMLRRLSLRVLNLGKNDCVIGEGAFKLANIFSSKTRRPMSDGLISSQEDEALKVIEQIIATTIGEAENKELCVFTVPANPIDSDRNNVYHTGAIELILRRLGYTPQKIEEGHAVVFAELEEQQFTGIGISCGGGMSNICVSYRGVPALSFSVSRGGDWIDRNVAQSLDMSVSRVSAIKEAGVDLNNPEGRVQEALVIYYHDLIRYTLDHISKQLSSKNSMPVFNKPIDIVVCGGTSMIGGFVDAIKSQLQTIRWPLDINRVRLARDPLKTVSHGCLNAALNELPQGDMQQGAL